MTSSITQPQNIDQYASLTAEQYAELALRLTTELFAREMAIYKQEKVRPRVVKYGSDRYRYYDEQKMTQDIPDDLTAMGIAEYIMAFCKSLPESIVTAPELCTKDAPEGAFPDDSLHLSWSQFNLVSEEVAIKRANGIVKCSVDSVIWRLKHQPGYQNTRQIMEYYHRVFPQCFNNL